MVTVNIHEAKTHLSKLLDKAAKGESVVITKAGKPMVRLVAFDAPAEKPKKRIGFMEGQGTFPEDFKSFGREEIEEIFSYPDTDERKQAAGLNAKRTTNI